MEVHILKMAIPHLEQERLYITDKNVRLYITDNGMHIFLEIVVCLIHSIFQDGLLF